MKVQKKNKNTNYINYQWPGAGGPAWLAGLNNDIVLM